MLHLFCSVLRLIYRSIQDSAENKILEGNRRLKNGMVGMKKRRKIWMWIVGIVLGGLGAAYFGGAVYFMDHFLFGTSLNGKDVSLKSVQKAEEILKDEVECYELILKEKDGKMEQISGEQIGLQYINQGEVNRMLKKQNPFLWCGAFFSETALTVSTEAEYDKGRLTNVIQNLSCYTEEETPLQNAVPEFDGTKYVIKKEVSGSGVDKEKFEKAVAEAVDSLAEELDLQKEKCYLQPQYTSESKEVIQACEKLNQYLRGSVTYTMDVPVTVDRKVIPGWLSVDENMNVKLDESGIKSWLTEFGDKYDTMGTTRTFATPNGKAASVTGGTYGWSIDEDTEFTVILNALKNGENVTREPAYYVGGTASVHTMPDWGSTYIDVDLSQQHIWCVINGTVALETDVVTGEPIPEKITPEGVYSILEKTMNTVLVGEIQADGEPEYRTHVDYWMRVTWTGIGFHDATWQSAFGGTLNQIPDVGSHGCINMPLDKAAELYNMIEVGTPVVIHY